MPSEELGLQVWVTLASKTDLKFLIQIQTHKYICVMRIHYVFKFLGCLHLVFDPEM
jgi:hypothetical protein